jgi:hypothetical protein
VDIATRFVEALDADSNAVGDDPDLLPVRLAHAAAAVLPVDGVGLSIHGGSSLRTPRAASSEVAAPAERCSSPPARDRACWPPRTGTTSQAATAERPGPTSRLGTGEPARCGTSPMREGAELGRGQLAACGAVELDRPVVDPAHGCRTSAARADLPRHTITHGAPPPSRPTVAGAGRAGSPGFGPSPCDACHTHSRTSEHPAHDERRPRRRALPLPPTGVGSTAWWAGSPGPRRRPWREGRCPAHRSSSSLSPMTRGGRS